MRAVVRGTIGPTKHRQEELQLMEETKGVGGGEEKKEDSVVPPLNLAEPKTSSKPAWAMTESVAKGVEDKEMEDEEEDLLAFAEGLDYDKYDEDLELKVLMDQVKTRIKELEKDGEMDEKVRSGEERKTGDALRIITGHCANVMNNSSFSRHRRSRTFWIVSSRRP